jgi:phosphoribosylformylglycinamidine synthase subunit PurL
MTATHTFDANSDQIIEDHGLIHEEYDRIVDIIGRHPNLVELGIFSVMWSEHCSYKTTRKWLKTLPTTGPQVICGPGENAGVVDIGDGQAIIFKMESHNHPSFIEPFQGAATGVGGIMRDVFTMGARPIALMNALRFGSPHAPKTRQIVEGVVAGIAHYGNCVGVPTVGGECIFHESYNGNPLVNAMCVGLADADKIFYSKASGVGNPVVYVGAKTGRDGIHGATMSSAEFDESTAEKRPTVQVGDPFREKLLIEACLELMQTDAIISIQDMGAAGLTCSSLEMAGKGDLGIQLELETVPMRETGMTPYEIMLSESQERMLMVLKPEKEAVARAIFEKWDLDYATIGALTDTGHMVLRMHGEVVCDIPVAPLSDAAPQLDRPYTLTVPQAALDPLSVPAPRGDIGQCLVQLLATPDLASKAWIYTQYDHQVMNDTVVKPGSDAGVVRIHGTQKAVAISTDCTPRYVAADPREGGKQAVAECYRNLITSGATPLAITDCLNFGNPEKPEIMGQIVGAIDGLREACTALSFPIVSGNVSLYNDTLGASVQPTPAIGGIGIIADVSRTLPNHFTEMGDAILVMGHTRGQMGQSLYLREVLGQEEGAPPQVDLHEELTHARMVQYLHSKHLLRACHDISDGGLLVALAEMCLAKNIGAQVRLPADLPAHIMAFAEDQARYILVVPHAQKDAVMLALHTGNIPFTDLGVTVPDMLIAEDLMRAPIAALHQAHQRFFAEFME